MKPGMAANQRPPKDLSKWKVSGASHAGLDMDAPVTMIWLRYGRHRRKFRVVEEHP